MVGADRYYLRGYNRGLARGALGGFLAGIAFLYVIMAVVQRW